MKIKSIEMDVKDGKPEEVTVVMSAEEALYLALITGKQNGMTSEKILPGGNELNSEIYECLTGDFFNRFFDGGAAEAKNVY